MVRPRRRITFRAGRWMPGYRSRSRTCRGSSSRTCRRSLYWPTSAFSLSPTRNRPMPNPTREKLWHLTDATLEVRADGELPPGIAGRVSGVALTYEVVDSYQTMFSRKCAKRSIDGRVAARKVPLLMDHERTSKAHVGVVTSMTDAGDALVMTADVFDTAEGRAAMEYVKAVLASGASTGFSIGFIPRASEMVTVDGKPVERFTEIELREVSITPMRPA